MSDIHTSYRRPYFCYHRNVILSFFFIILVLNALLVRADTSEDTVGAEEVRIERDSDDTKYEAQIKNLHKEIETVTNQLKDARAENKKLKKLFISEYNEKDKLREKYNDALKRIADARTEQKHTLEHMETGKEIQERYEKELKKKEKGFIAELDSLATVMRGAKKERDNAVDALTRAKAELAEVKEENKKLTGRKEGFENAVREKMQESIDELRKQIDAFGDEKTLLVNAGLEYTAQITKYKNTVTTLETKIAELEIERNQLGEKQVELYRIIGANKNKHMRENTELQKKIEMLQNQRKEENPSGEKKDDMPDSNVIESIERQKNILLGNDIQELEDTVKRQKERMTILEKENDSLREEIEESRATVGSIVVEKAAFTKAIGQDERAVIEEKQKELHDEIKKLMEEREVLGERVHEMSNKNTSLEKKIKQQKDAQGKEVAELKEECNARIAALKLKNEKLEQDARENQTADGAEDEAAEESKSRLRIKKLVDEQKVLEKKVRALRKEAEAMRDKNEKLIEKKEEIEKENDKENKKLRQQLNIFEDYLTSYNEMEKEVYRKKKEYNQAQKTIIVQREINERISDKLERLRDQLDVQKTRLQEHYKQKEARLEKKLRILEEKYRKLKSQ